MTAFALHPAPRRDVANGSVFRATASVCVAAVGMLALAVVLLNIFGSG